MVSPSLACSIWCHHSSICRAWPAHVSLHWSLFLSWGQPVQALLREKLVRISQKAFCFNALILSTTTKTCSPINSKAQLIHCHLHPEHLATARRHWQTRTHGGDERWHWAAHHRRYWQLEKSVVRERIVGGGDDCRALVAAFRRFWFLILWIGLAKEKRTEFGFKPFKSKPN